MINAKDLKIATNKEVFDLVYKELETFVDSAIKYGSNHGHTVHTIDNAEELVYDNTSLTNTILDPALTVQLLIDKLIRELIAHGYTTIVRKNLIDGFTTIEIRVR